MTTLPCADPGYLFRPPVHAHVLMLAQLGAHVPAVDLLAQRL